MFWLPRVFTVAHRLFVAAFGPLLLWNMGSAAMLCGLCSRGMGLVAWQHVGS